MSFEEFEVVNDGVRLYCKRYEPSSKVPSGDRPPLLLIHGGCIDCDFYDGAGPLLANLFDVVTFDRRGFGRSTHPESKDYSVAAQETDALAVASTAFGDAPLFVFAHSAGGSIGVAFSTRHPHRIRQLMLFEAPLLDCVDPASPLMADIAQVKKNIEMGQEAGSFGSGFLFGLGPKDPRARKATREQKARASANVRTSVACEADIFFGFKPDYDVLAKLPVVVAAAEMNRGHLLEGLATSVAQRLGCPLVRYPGAHNCPSDLPVDFACMTAGVFLMEGKGLLSGSSD